MLRTPSTAVVIESLEDRRLLAGISVEPFNLPKGTNFPGNLTVGADKNIWFTCGLAPYIGELNPSTGVATIYSTKAIGTDGPQGLTLGSNGTIYFANFWENAISFLGRKGKVSKLSGLYSGPEDLVNGPDGNLWFTSFNNGIGQVNPGTGALNYFPNTGAPFGLGTANPPVTGEAMVSFNGQLYFEEGYEIGRITTAGAYDGMFATPAGGDVQAIAVVGKNLWFTENHQKSTSRNNYVGYITAHGQVAQFPVPVSYGSLAGIAPASNGDVYVCAGQTLLAINGSGQIVATQDLGIASGGTDMVTGANGNVFFTEGVQDKITEVGVSAPVTGGTGHGGPPPVTQGVFNTSAAIAASQGQGADDLLFATDSTRGDVF